MMSYTKVDLDRILYSYIGNEILLMIFFQMESQDEMFPPLDEETNQSFLDNCGISDEF